MSGSLPSESSSESIYNRGQGDCLQEFIKTKLKELDSTDDREMIKNLKSIEMYISMMLQLDWQESWKESYASELLELYFKQLRKPIMGLFSQEYFKKHREEFPEIHKLLLPVSMDELDFDAIATAQPERPSSWTGLFLLIRKYGSKRQRLRAVREKVLEDLGQEYVGHGVEHLHAHIRNLDCSGSSSVYANVLPFIQSSGSGKTRSVLELCKREVGVYTCIRESSETDDVNQAVSAPAQDSSVFEVLAAGRSFQPETLTAQHESIARVATWLKALVETLYDLCLEQFEQAGPNFDLPGIIDTKLNSGLFERVDTAGIESQNLRKDFFTKIKNRASQYREAEKDRAVSTPLEASWAAFLDENFQKMQTILDRWDSTTAGTAPSTKAAKKGKTKPISRRTPGTFIFLAVDEASSMGHERIVHLRRLMNHLRKGPSFWIILLDTSNNISELAGAKAKKASPRLVDGVKHLLQPFTTTPHDVFLTEEDYGSVLNGVKPASYEDLLSYLFQMGRPVWNDSHLQSIRGESSATQIAGRDLSFIYRKLLIDENPPGMRHSGIIAAVAQRLPLRFTGYQGPKTEINFLEGQVAFHLRTVLSVTEDRIVTASKSEPILSLSVADCVRKDSPHEWWSKAIQAIFNLVDSKTLHPGDTAEECFQILLTLSMDVALRRGSSLKRTPRGLGTLPQHLMPINALIFLRQLFGSRQLSKDVVAWAECHWINFTHFLPPLGNQVTAESSPASKLLLMEAFTRQAAVIGIVTQPSWDLLVPAYRSKDFELSATINPDTFDAMVFQVKNRKGYRPKQKDWIRDHNDGVKAKIPDHDLNIFVSLMAARPEFQSPDRAPHGAKGGSNPLAIFVSGHGPEQYPSLSTLTKEGQKSFANLLQRSVPISLPGDRKTECWLNYTHYQWKEKADGSDIDT